MNNEQFKQPMNKMDLIIHLLALNLVREMKTQKEKIIALYSLELNSSKTAEIFGTTANTVNVALSRLKTKTKMKIDAGYRGKEE